MVVVVVRAFLVVGVVGVVVVVGVWRGRGVVCAVLFWWLL